MVCPEKEYPLNYLVTISCTIQGRSQVIWGRSQAISKRSYKEVIHNIIILLVMNFKVLNVKTYPTEMFSVFSCLKPNATVAL